VRDSPGDQPAREATRRSSRSVFGSAPARRPDMLTSAETMVMPWLRKSRAPVPADQAATQVLPAPVRSEREMLRVRRPAPRQAAGRRATVISRLALLAILVLQAVLSLRLHNTAFEDEATYLYAGHMELEHLLHGTALQGDYASYFSGAPVLYPVLGAIVDQAGGLAAARALSLVEMLATTALLYALTRRLFNERIGLCAAALFAVTESAIFLGNFATYDATCLSLLALAAWIAVRTSAFRWPAFLLAALPAALAVAVKYAGLLFVPTIAVLPALAGWPERGRRVLWYPAGLGVAVAGLLLAALRLGGKAYATALSATTTSRAQGTTPDGTILRESLAWGGVLFAVAVIGTVAYVWRVRTEPDEQIAPAGGRVRRAALGAVLTGTALLAPAYQAHLHTDISFLKHIGFGLFFAAPMAGFGLARIMGDYVRRPLFGVAVWALALALGVAQSGSLYHVWPSSGPLVTSFGKYLRPHARYLVEVPEVPIYYLMGNPDAQPGQFTSTYNISYTDAKGRTLTGPAGFAAAVRGGYFQVIAYSDTVTPAADAALATALRSSHSYHLAARVHLSDATGPVVYDIWVKGRR
jgi:Dolichyl-phosphate-mannose-protein mannosyltransferase